MSPHSAEPVPLMMTLTELMSASFLGESYQKLTHEFGEPAYDRVQASATPEAKQRLANLSPQQVTLTKLAGEKIQTILTHAPGNGAPIGGLKVVTESGWFAARPSGIEPTYRIYAERFQGAEHLRQLFGAVRMSVTATLSALQKPGIASEPNPKENA